MSAQKPENPREKASPSQTPKSGRFQRIRRVVLLFLVVPYVAVTLLMTGFQRKLIYHPARAKDLSVSAVGLDAETVRDVKLKTADGETLKGWLWEGEAVNDSDGANPLVVYFPGNALHRRYRINDIKEFARAGFDVLLFDYRGYGDSTGSPSEEKLTADAWRIWEFATEELGYDPGAVILFGESLGGAVALSLWSKGNPQPAAVLLNSTFASLPGTVAWHYPAFPFQFLLWDRWPSKERIGRVSAPVLIFHGTRDEIVPLSQGRELARHGSSAEFIEISGGTHNSIPMPRLITELERIRIELAN